MPATLEHPRRRQSVDDERLAQPLTRYILINDAADILPTMRALRG
ncbi:hypothetical protein [Arthrobacter sp. FW306-2-2C-D06B]|nr:hypothetical protein [Arthrobacter sp. FW306-2-2C-D06B]